MQRPRSYASWSPETSRPAEPPPPLKTVPAPRVIQRFVDPDGMTVTAEDIGMMPLPEVRRYLQLGRNGLLKEVTSAELRALELRQAALAPSPKLDESTPLVQLPPSSSSLSSPEEPQLNAVQQLARQLFSAEDLAIPEVKHLILSVLGEGFLVWAGSGMPPEEALQVEAMKLAEQKAESLRKRYPDLTVIDLIVLYSYSWRADTYLRKARGDVPLHTNFGSWQIYAEQMIKSLRKLRRFVGTTLYRASRPAETQGEGEALKKTPFHAYSFLSTTYTEEARDSLEQNPKYERGQTIEIDATDVEGYHLEDFSQFPGEHEVVLLPGHTLTSTGSKWEERERKQGIEGKSEKAPREIILVKATPPPDTTPMPSSSPSAEEFAALRKQKQLELPPPPKFSMPSPSPLLPSHSPHSILPPPSFYPSSFYPGLPLPFFSGSGSLTTPTPTPTPTPGSSHPGRRRYVPFDFSSIQTSKPKATLPPSYGVSITRTTKGVRVVVTGLSPAAAVKVTVNGGNPSFPPADESGTIDTIVAPSSSDLVTVTVSYLGDERTETL